jgi:hypothetical protein
MLLPALHIRYHTAAILAVHLGTVGIRSPIQRSYTFSTIIPSFHYSMCMAYQYNAIKSYLISKSCTISEMLNYYRVS